MLFYFNMKGLTTIFLMFVILQTFSQQKVYTTKRTSTPPVIDGYQEDVWDIAEWDGNFWQHEPYDDRRPSQQTNFKILYDDDNIYVLIFAEDSEAQKINKRMSRRDTWEGDLTGIQFDTYNDNRTSFAFVVSAAGVKTDAIYTNDGDNENLEWDPIWFVKTNVTDKGWYAEMQIPISQLRFSSEDNKSWGLQLARYIFRKDEFTIWKGFSRDKHGWVQHFGTLKGIENLNPKKQIEFVPYLVAGIDKDDISNENPFRNKIEPISKIGLDGKIGLSNDFILDFTINPDFGQIEADPSVVNLTAFEVFYDERRPFFIEGKSITDFSLGTDGARLFYSRRIGKSPSYHPDVSGDAFVDAPQNTNILGAIKITGKTKNGLSVGIIESLTSKEFAHISENGVESKEMIEPLTNYFLARVQQDFNGGRSQFGGIITSTNRAIETDNLNFLPNTAVSGGLNYKKYWKEKTYYFISRASFSHIVGSKNSISRLQTSARRFFQRPDADYVTFNDDRNTLSGTQMTVMAGKQGSSGWRFGINATYLSPEFAVNDLGYVRLTDKISQWSWGGYKTKKPFSVFRDVSINASQWSGYDFGGRRMFSGADMTAEANFTNNWYFKHKAGHEFQDFNNFLMRGGGGIYTPGGNYFNTEIQTNSTKDIVLELTNNYYDYDEFKNGYKFILELEMQPLNALSVDIEAEYSYEQNNMQYIDLIDIEDADNEYLFASIFRNTYSISINLNYNITPDFTLQYYAAPYISNGVYNGFKTVANPVAEDYYDRFHKYSEYSYWKNMENSELEIDDDNDGNVDYFVNNPDFNFKEFNSNLVLRWEYQPGSVFYLVWSQYRLHTDNIYEYRIARSYKNLFSTFPKDVFMLKFTYNIDANKFKS